MHKRPKAVLDFKIIDYLRAAIMYLYIRDVLLKNGNFSNVVCYAHWI